MNIPTNLCEDTMSKRRYNSAKFISVLSLLESVVLEVRKYVFTILSVG